MACDHHFVSDDGPLFCHFCGIDAVDFHSKQTQEAVKVLEAVLLFLHDRDYLFVDCRTANLWSVIANTISKLHPDREFDPEDEPDHQTDNWLIDDYLRWWLEPGSITAAHEQQQDHLNSMFKRWKEREDSGAGITHQYSDGTTGVLRAE